MPAHPSPATCPIAALHLTHLPCFQPALQRPPSPWKRRIWTARLCNPPNSVPPSGPYTPNEASCSGEDGPDADFMEWGSEVRAQGRGHKEATLTAGLSRGRSRASLYWGGRLEPFTYLRPLPRAWGTPHLCSVPRPPCWRKGLSNLRSPSTCSPKGPSRATQLVSRLS